MVPKIVIDTREQRPWTFDGMPSIQRGLRTGDYSIDGHTEPPDGIVIERKSAEDLLAACRGIEIGSFASWSGWPNSESPLSSSKHRSTPF